MYLRNKKNEGIKKDRGLEILLTNLLEAGNCTFEAVSGANGRRRQKHSAFGVQGKL